MHIRRNLSSVLILLNLEELSYKLYFCILDSSLVEGGYLSDGGPGGGYLSGGRSVTYLVDGREVTFSEGGGAVYLSGGGEKS